MIHWDLPGPNRFLEGVAESLSEGKHALMVLPDPVRRCRPVSVLTRKLRDAGLGGVSGGPIGNLEDDPFDVLAEVLGCHERKPGSTPELLNYQNAPSKFIFLDLGRGDHDAGMKQWAQLLTRAAEHAKQASFPPYQLIVSAGPMSVLPSEDLMLPHHIWWGVVNSADIDWVVERALLDYPPSNTSEHYWIRSLSRGLSGSDMSLAQMLVEEMPTDIEAAIRLLDVHTGAELMATVPPSTENGSFIPYGKRCSPPPRDDQEKKLWELGQLDWMNGHGNVVHSSILAATGQISEIKRRIWMSQLELLLPLVERVRLSLTGWLASKIGENWVDKLTENLSTKDRDDIETEIGTLAHHLFRSVSKLSSHKDFPTLKKTVWAWREIRNELAHGRFVPLPMLEEAWTSYDEFIEKCA